MGVLVKVVGGGLGVPRKKKRKKGRIGFGRKGVVAHGDGVPFDDDGATWV